MSSRSLQALSYQPLGRLSFIANPFASRFGLHRAYTGALGSQVANVFVKEGHLISLGDTVRFRSADIFLPLAEELPGALTEGEVLEGTICSFSDSSQEPRVFAVVEVVIRRNVVVPMVKLQVIKTRDSAEGN